MDFWGTLATMLLGRAPLTAERKRVKVIAFDQCVILGREPNEFTPADIDHVIDALVSNHPGAPETAAAECRPIVLAWVEHFKQTGHPGY